MLALYIIGGLLVLLVAVLSVPVDIRMRAYYRDGPGYKASIRWLFGLVTLPVAPAKKPKKAARQEAREKPRKKKRGPGIRTMLDVLRTRGLIGEVKRLVSAVIHRFHVRDLVGEFEAGFEDPADTGMLFAAIGPAMSCRRPSIINNIRLIPLPDASAACGSVSGIIRLWPVSFVPPVVRFLLSIPVILSLKAFLVGTWRDRHAT